MITIDGAADDIKVVVANTIEKFITNHRLNKKASCQVFFVTAKKMRALNLKYRKINKTTDVLSFPVWDSISKMPKKGEINLGDIFVNQEEPTKRISFLVEHSLNHLIGKHH